MKMSQQRLTNKNEVLLMFYAFSSSVQCHAQKIKTNIQAHNFLFLGYFIALNIEYLSTSMFIPEA